MKFIPANADVSRLEGWSAKISIATIVITTPFGSFTPPRLLPITSTSPDFDIQANAFLEWLGLNHDAEDGEIWMVLVPSLQVWGRTRPDSPECLTRMTQDAAAHELAHCLNQEHINLLCPDGKRATGGDTPEQWGEDGGAVVDVPFDIGANGTVTSSSGVFELMTYCGTRWTSPQRWQRLFDFIGE